MVSHGHLPEIRALLKDCQVHLDPTRFEILVTLNLAEPDDGLQLAWRGPMTVIRNAQPKGFGANHNAAMRRAVGTWVATVDPDLRLSAGDPFTGLEAELGKASTGIVSPPVMDEHGDLSDHAREVPTPRRLFRRYVRGGPVSTACRRTDPQDVDWIAGLLMATRRDTFRTLGGFDERFHMYCEDVDLCLRSWNAGLAVRVVPGVHVMHPARRRTLKHPRHFLWHVASLVRLWSSASYRAFGRTR